MHVPDLFTREAAFEFFFGPWCEPCRHDNLRQRLDTSFAAWADGAIVAIRQIVMAGLYLLRIAAACGAAAPLGT